ncbi:MAG: hypothetical protein M0Z25_10200 [Nitrospiraceae bacterium]|nr:hypothetical protein [Nitrospiraceae bacterium]
MLPQKSRPGKKSGTTVFPLDLHREELIAPFKKEIDLVARPGLPEGKARFQSPVQPGLEELSHDKGFEERPKLGVGGDLLRGPDPQKPGNQSGIGVEQFWGLEKPLVEVLVMGNQKKQ